MCRPCAMHCHAIFRLLLRQVCVMQSDGVNDPPKRGSAEVVRIGQFLVTSHPLDPYHDTHALEWVFQFRWTFSNQLSWVSDLKPADTGKVELPHLVFWTVFCIVVSPGCEQNKQKWWDKQTSCNVLPVELFPSPVTPTKTTVCRSKPSSWHM